MAKRKSDILHVQGIDVGIVTKAGRYNGGTYAHSDIAMDFLSYPLQMVLRSNHRLTYGTEIQQ